LAYPGAGTVPLYLALGALMGLLGILYNQAILGALAVQKRLLWPSELRAALVGAAVGALAWWGPGLVGGGDLLTQSTLAGKATIPYLL
ncbi:chloride channel protein, partial [Acinetobacter baumannii]